MNMTSEVHHRHNTSLTRHALVPYVHGHYIYTSNARVHGLIYLAFFIEYVGGPTITRQHTHTRTLISGKTVSFPVGMPRTSGVHYYACATTTTTEIFNYFFFIPFSRLTAAPVFVVVPLPTKTRSCARLSGSIRVHGTAGVKNRLKIKIRSPVHCVITASLPCPYAERVRKE